MQICSCQKIVTKYTYFLNVIALGIDTYTNILKHFVFAIIDINQKLEKKTFETFDSCQGSRDAQNLIDSM